MGLMSTPKTAVCPHCGQKAGGGKFCEDQLNVCGCAGAAGEGMDPVR